MNPREEALSRHETTPTFSLNNWICTYFVLKNKGKHKSSVCLGFSAPWEDAVRQIAPPCEPGLPRCAASLKIQDVKALTINTSLEPEGFLISLDLQAFHCIWVELILMAWWKLQRGLIRATKFVRFVCAWKTGCIFFDRTIWTDHPDLQSLPVGTRTLLLSSEWGNSVGIEGSKMIYPCQGQILQICGPLPFAQK